MSPAIPTESDQKWADRAKLRPPRCPLHKSVMRPDDNGIYRCNGTSAATDGGEEACRFFVAAANIHTDTFTNKGYAGELELMVEVVKGDTPEENRIKFYLVLPYHSFRIDVTRYIDADSPGGGVEVGARGSVGHKLHLKLDRLTRI